MAKNNDTSGGIDFEVHLPGTDAREDQPEATNYRITVERGDGIACTEIEAFMILYKCGYARAKDRTPFAGEE